MLRMRWWVYEQGWQTKQKSWCAHTRSRGVNFSMIFVGALALGWSWILVHSIHHDGEEQDKCVTQSRRDVTGRVFWEGGHCVEWHQQQFRSVWTGGLSLPCNRFFFLQNVSNHSRNNLSEEMLSTPNMYTSPNQYIA
jgi:hypothetical protein